jgi:hypothetical protein
VGNAKMSPGRRTDKLKPNMARGVLTVDSGRSDKLHPNCARKNIAFPAIYGRISQHFTLHSLPSRTVGRQVLHRVRLFQLRKTQYTFESNRNHELVGPGQVFRQTHFPGFRVVISNR